MNNHHDKDIDQVSGIETTGHEWDGIKELNNPAPRWWLWIFYICILWSVGYWVIYPAWPTLSGKGHRGGTVGHLQTNQYQDLAISQQDIVARRAQYMERFKASSFSEIVNDPELYAFALAGGKSAFKDNCATCHGSGGAGAPGYPNLNDDDWIWGGSLEDIQKTITYGVRNDHPESRSAMMPPFEGMLDGQALSDVADYVFALSHQGALNSNGELVFKQQCASCHGEDARGIRESGAPNLADAIWLKSKDGSKAAILNQIRNPKHGIMPVWEERLDPQTIRQLSIYVHSLGGGE